MSDELPRLLDSDKDPVVGDLLKAAAADRPTKSSAMRAALALGLSPTWAFGISGAQAALLAVPLLTLGVYVGLVDRAPAAKAPSAPAVVPATGLPRGKALEEKEGEASVSEAASVPSPAGTAQPKEDGAQKAERARSPSSIAEQIRLMDQVRALSAAGERKGALDLLTQYERRFPQAFFAQEAMYLRAHHLDALGRKQEARAIALRYLKLYPKSPNARKMEAIAQ